MIPFNYSLRSVARRRASSLLILGSTALVVASFVGVGALTRGLQGTFQSSGDPDVLLVLRQGSVAEIGSFIQQEEVAALRTLPELGDGARAEPELLSSLNLEPREGDGRVQATVRGVGGDDLLASRDGVELAAGRAPRGDAYEALVGAGVARRAAGTGIGDSLEIHGALWEVVGILDAGGGLADSEIWVPRERLAAASDRRHVSTVRVRLGEGGDLAALQERLGSDARLQLTAEPESEFYARQAGLARPLQWLGWLIAAALGLGAGVALANTLHAMVHRRQRELATLRVLGFGRSSLFLAVLVESVVLALAGGVVGCLLVLPLDGWAASTLHRRTFTEIAFAFRVTPELLALGLVLAVVIGLVGGALPAWRALRLRPVTALRQP